MLDIWHKDSFFVIQFEDYVGVSEITEENPGFSTVPDEIFHSEEEYKNRLKDILN
jgi:hypothetical protein